MINTGKLLQIFKADLKAAEPLKIDNDLKIADRKKVFDGDLYGNEEKGKSRIVPKVAKRQSDWLHASIKEAFVSTPDIMKASPITASDVTTAKKNEILLNYQFCRQFNRYNFITKALKVLDAEATCIVQTGWVYEEEKIEVEKERPAYDEYGNQLFTPEGYPITEVYMDVETKMVKNHPDAIIRRSQDVYIDPTCGDDYDKAQFIIVRYETDMSTLRSDPRYKNLDKIDINKSIYSDDYDPIDKSTFQFEDEPRKKILVYEYWGNYDINDDGIVEPIVCSWVGDTIIRLQDNPFPDKKPPFLIVPYSSVPFELYGENNIDLIADYQQIITAIMRGFIDNMANSNNGQIGTRKNSLSPADIKKLQRGEHFEFRGSPNDIWMGSYNQIPASTFNILSLINNEIESSTGVKSYSQGLTTPISGGGNSGRNAMDSTSIRRMDVVRNIAENLIKPLLRKWMAYNSEFLSDEEVIRVTEDIFEPVRRDDLAGNIDIDITISTSEDNANKASELGFLLQTLGNTMPFEMTQMVLSKIVKLYKLPDLEKAVKEYKPQPDQYQEQMKQIDLQRAMLILEELKAGIGEKQSQARENDADVMLKQAKAQGELAKTEKTKSETDHLDIDYIKKDEREDFREKILMKEIDRQIMLDGLKFQQLNGDKQLGMPR